MESEMRHLRKIEGVLIQLRYMNNVAEHYDFGINE